MFIVAPHCQIMTQLGLKDSSRNFLVNCVIGFFFLHLILNARVQIYNMTAWEILFVGTKQALIYCRLLTAKNHY